MKLKFMTALEMLVKRQIDEEGLTVEEFASKYDMSEDFVRDVIETSEMVRGERRARG